MNFIKKIPLKFLILIILTVLFCAFWLMDFCISKSYHMEYTYESLYGDLTADQKNAVTITVTLTRNGKPVANHSLWMDNPKCNQQGDIVSGGQLQKNIRITDENGQAQFTYYPYTANKLKPANYVLFVVKDYSNSLVVESNATLKFILELI